MLKKVARITLSLFFIVAGRAHFTNSAFFLAIVPPILPFPQAIVYISGFFEILGGVAVLIPQFRHRAGQGLIALLIAVFPANIYMAVYNIPLGDTPVNPILLWLRLPIQFLFIAWVWWATKEE